MNAEHEAPYSEASEGVAHEGTPACVIGQQFCRLPGQVFSVVSFESTHAEQNAPWVVRRLAFLAPIVARALPKASLRIRGG